MERGLMLDSCTYSYVNSVQYRKVAARGEWDTFAHGAHVFFAISCSALKRIRVKYLLVTYSLKSFRNIFILRLSRKCSASA